MLELLGFWHEPSQTTSPAEGEFLFEIDEQPLEECLTALGGVPLLLRTLRSLDVPGQRAARSRSRSADAASAKPPAPSCVVQ